MDFTFLLLLQMSKTKREKRGSERVTERQVDTDKENRFKF